MIVIPETVPIPELPVLHKNLTPVAITPTEHPVFDPEREGKDEAAPKNRPRRKGGQDKREDGSPQASSSIRGTRVDIHA